MSKRYHYFFKFDWIFVIFGQHLAIYTVFYKESESEVNKSKILDPGRENIENQRKTYFSNFYFCFNLIFFQFERTPGSMNRLFSDLFRDFLSDFWRTFRPDFWPDFWPGF